MKLARASIYLPQGHSRKPVFVNGCFYESQVEDLDAQETIDCKADTIIRFIELIRNSVMNARKPEKENKSRGL